MDYNAQCGDIFLCDSDRTGAKIVKFFMTAPTWYIYLYRMIRHTQQPVRYYHAGMVLSNEQMIEQQGKVQYGQTQKILNRRITIYRKKNLTEEQKELLRTRAIAQLGQGYGIEDVIAHTLTWLTGIRLFTYIVGALSRNRDICVNRVARWYNHICNFDLNWYEITTKTMDEYCQNHPEEWESIYVNGEGLPKAEEVSIAEE
jgi:hypothetical protein